MLRDNATLPFLCLRRTCPPKGSKMSCLLERQRDEEIQKLQKTIHNLQAGSRAMKRKLGNQTSLATKLLNVATNLDLVNPNARDAARAVYDLLKTEDELGQPKPPDVNSARRILYQTHSSSHSSETTHH